MARQRLYEIAQELGLSSAHLIERLRQVGLTVKSHQSAVDPSAVRHALQQKASEKMPKGASTGKSKKTPKGSGRLASAAAAKTKAATKEKGGRQKDLAADGGPKTALVAGAVLIKKYGNRRLYSTAESRYLTLEELEALVRSGQRVQVVEAASGEDITPQILTQILIEGGRARRLPVALLEQLIRLSDGALKTVIDRYLMTGLDMFLGAQREMERRYQQSLSSFGMWPFGAMQPPVGLGFNPMDWFNPVPPQAPSNTGQLATAAQGYPPAYPAPFPPIAPAAYPGDAPYPSPATAQPSAPGAYPVAPGASHYQPQGAADPLSPQVPVPRPSDDHDALQRSAHEMALLRQRMQELEQVIMKNNAKAKK